MNIQVFTSEPDDRFELRPSTIPGAGLGVFARRDLPPGSELEVVGVLIERDTLSDRCSHFADHHKFVVGDKLLLIPLGFGGMVNHSPNPNVAKCVRGTRVFLTALRPIAAGEELFLCYGPGALARMGLV